MVYRLTSFFKIATILIVIVSFSFCKRTKYKNYCKSEMKIEGINEDSVNVFIPLAFTPNGDGRNDLYRFECTGIAKYTVEIKRNFKTAYSVSNASYWSWDGSNSNGKIKDGEYDVEAELVTITGDLVTVTTTISIITENEIYPCRCTVSDQIDPQLGFISQPSQVCDYSEQ